MKFLKVPFILVLFIVTFFDAGVHQGYFLLTDTFLTKGVGVEPRWVMAIMSLGQIAEIGTMAVLGWCLKKLGWRRIMTLGVLAHAIRFGVFAFVPHAVPVILVILLHGVCYAFFFATVYIFVDEFLPKDARSSAQGLFNFLILGAGPFVGNIVWSELQGRMTEDGVTDFKSLFVVPSSVALAAALFLLIAFRPPKSAVAGSS